MAIEWKRPMKPQPIRPMFTEVTTPRVRDGWGDESRFLGQAFEYVIERRRHELGQCGPPILRRCARRYVAAEQALLESHEDRIDDVPRDRRVRIARKFSLVLVSA